MKQKIFCVTFLFIALWMFGADNVAIIVNLPTDMSVTDNARQRDFAANDTKSLVKVLRENCGYDVKIIDDFTQLTSLTDIFDNLTNQQNLKSVFFYYGGYGFKIDGKQYFLIDSYDSYYKTRTSIGYDRLLTYFRKMSDKTKILAFFNYNTFGTNEVEENNFEFNEEKNIMIVKAASNKIKVYENYEKPHSAFAFFLTEALRGQADLNDDYYITFDEVLSYLSHNYQRYLARANSRTNTAVSGAKIQSNLYISTNQKSVSLNSQLSSRFNEAFDSEFDMIRRNQRNETDSILRVDQVQFFNPKNLAICKDFSQKTTTYVGFDVLCRLQSLPDPHEKIVVNLYVYYPDGSLMCKLNKLCQPILSMEGAMFCRAIYGWEDSGRWSSGEYTVKIGYKNAILKTAHFIVK